MPNKYLDSVQLARLVTKIKDHVSTSISTAISGSITTLINQAKAEAILAAHPVGSYYWSDNSTSPATLFGGTWQALPAGYTLIAQGSGTDSFGNFTYTAGQTYGERMHTLTVGEIPSHYHALAQREAPADRDPSTQGAYSFAATSGYCSRVSKTGFDYGNITTSTGNGSPHNNLSPCKAAYAWKRTA